MKNCLTALRNESLITLLTSLRDVLTLSQDLTHKKLDGPAETRQHVWEDIHNVIMAGPGEEEKSDFGVYVDGVTWHTQGMGHDAVESHAFTSAGAPETLE